MRAEMTRGVGQRGQGGRPITDSGGGGGSSGGGGGDRRSQSFRRDRGSYSLSVSGLPESASWQDLKDHMREAGAVSYTDVDRRGRGLVTFRYRDDLKYALDRLDDTKLKTHAVCFRLRAAVVAYC